MENSIAYGVHNQLRDISDPELYLRVKGASLFYLERLRSNVLEDFNYSVRIICEDQVHEILEKALEEKYKYCVVFASGCLIKNPDFHEVIHEFVKNHTFGVAGHLLWKQDGTWLELHQQFFIVNLSAWEKVGKPEFGTWEGGEHLLPVLIRSKENFHDDYTPIWVKATGEQAMQARPSQGWKLLSAMFNGGESVITLSEKVRLGKFYTYPEFETNDYMERIKNLTVDKSRNWNQNKWIMDNKFVKDQIWLYNSESLHIKNKSGPYDIVVNTASGFKIFDFFRTPRLADNARIIIYDFNPKSIDWYKHFHSWPNDDLLECIRSFPDRNHFTWIGQCDPVFVENRDFQWRLTENYEHFGGEEKFTEYWQQFKKMNVEFHVVDLYKNPQELALLLTGKGKKFVNLTNIFSTDASQLIFGHAECMAAQYRLFGYLYTVDPEIDVTIYDFWNRHRIGKVKDLI